jgi:hypothetical protein
MKQKQHFLSRFYLAYFVDPADGQSLYVYEEGGKPAVEWTWDGNDEMDEASGRGWAVLQDDGTLKGKLFFHRGDSSGFTAAKPTQAKKGGRKVLAVDVNTGKARRVAVDALKEGKLHHDQLPADLLRRIAWNPQGLAA